MATEFVILRGVRGDAAAQIALDREPLRVASILSEERLVASDYTLLQHDTTFLHDRAHDWAWRNGQFRYFASKDQADLLIVFAERERRGLFCGACGARLAADDSCPEGCEPGGAN